MSNTRAILITTDGGQYELSVNPKQLSITEENNDKKIDLLNMGTVSIPGNRGLIGISINTFLPALGSPFNKTNVDPESIISNIRKSKNGKRPVRIIVSGTSINTTFFVSSLNTTYMEGQKDIEVAWSFTEDRQVNVSPVASSSNRDTSTGLCSRNDNSAIPKTVNVKKNDNLWNIAKQYYGDGSQWQKIATANGIKDEKKLQIGTTLVIPK